MVVHFRSGVQRGHRRGHRHRGHRHRRPRRVSGSVVVSRRWPEASLGRIGPDMSRFRRLAGLHGDREGSAISRQHSRGSDSRDWTWKQNDRKERVMFNRRRWLMAMISSFIMNAFLIVADAATFSQTGDESLFQAFEGERFPGLDVEAE